MPSFEVSKVEVWSGEIPDQPGGLANVLEALAGAGAALECVVARRQPDKPGTGVVYVTPVKGRRAQAAASAVGLKPAGNIATLRLESSFDPAAGGIIGRAIEQAGINVRGVSGVKAGNNMVAYIGFDSMDDA